MKKNLLIFLMLSISWMTPGSWGATGIESLGTATGFRTGEGSQSAISARARTGQSGLLQIRSGGQVLGFHPDRVYLAGEGVVLIEEFVSPSPDRPAPRFMARDNPLEYPGRVRGESPPERVLYPELWKGISAVYESRPGALGESTFVVQPGAEVGHIRLRYNARIKKMPDGSLRFNPEDNRGYFRQTAPAAWQEIDGIKKPVPAEFRLIDDRTVGYRVAAYNPQHTLIIDPVYQWHTFYGSGYDDQGKAIALDSAGNIYLAGTSSATWLGDVNAAPKHAHSGGADLVVMKLNSAGVYQWHTFFGSGGTDEGRGIALDGDGNVYVLGSSSASWEADKKKPIHAHAGASDMVVLKLNNSGVYQWHTFYGSSNQDFGNQISLDGTHLYITGSSQATWNGEGGGPLNPFSAGKDILILKLSTSGVYQWHTFYGSTDDDEGQAVKVDGSGHVFVIGSSENSWKGAGTEEALHPFQGQVDITILKLAGNGTYLWHTFQGSAGEDYGWGAVLDDSGALYITGSSDMAWQGGAGDDQPPLHPHSGQVDLYVLKLDGTGAYQWHTFYGPGIIGLDQGIALDGGGHIYVTGSSSGEWMGDGGTPPRRSFSGSTDITLLKLKADGRYDWHTFYGSGLDDGGAALAADGAGVVYLTGHSNDSWLGENGAVPIHAAHGKARDIVVLKLQGAVLIQVTALGNGTGLLESQPPVIQFSYPAVTTGRAWLNPFDTLLLVNTAASGYRAHWAGTCGNAGGVEAGINTSLNSCSFIQVDRPLALIAFCGNQVFLPLVLQY